MDESTQEFAIYFTLNNTLKYIKPPSLKIQTIDIPEGFLIQDIYPLSRGRLIINGAKLVESGYKEHSFYLLNNFELLEINCHDFGIIGFKMVANDDTLFLISDKKCQTLSLANGMYRKIKEMKSIHINPGCCVFNQNILVIGGINNRLIEVYDVVKLKWKYVGEINLDLFSIGCVQIREDEVLVINYKEYIILNGNNGKILVQELLPIKAKSPKIGCPVKFGNYVFCILAKTRLLRYNIVNGKWTVVNRSPACCCLLM